MIAFRPQHTQPSRTSSAGFTLIELMIVIAIIGILASIAMPSYRDYVRKSEMTKVVTLANSLATKQIEFYNINGRWALYGDNNDMLATMGTTNELDFADGDYIVRARTTASSGVGVVFVQVEGSLIGLSGVQWIRLELVDTGVTITKSFCSSTVSGTQTPSEAYQYLPCG